MWGYPMEVRSRQLDESKYKFTSKERDIESNYDYFGARYYDARIANWTTIDPLFEKHIGWTPYNYVLRNPLRLIDPDGRQVDFSIKYSGGEEETTEDYKDINETNERVEQRNTSKEKSNRYGDLVRSSKGIYASNDEFLCIGAISTTIRTALGLGASREIAYVVPKYAEQLEIQLSKHGAESIYNSLKSTMSVLSKHIDKLKTAEKTSSIEKEIITFSNQLETIIQFIINKGL